MNPPSDGTLQVLPIAHIPPEPLERPPWLIDQLWAHQAVGIIGGAPKCCKTFLALEIAVAVASGRPCLGRFDVLQPGPVLLFAAEDPPLQLRHRILGLAKTRGADFNTLPIFLILAHQLRLDLPDDLARLSATVEQQQPRLLVLDPFVRLHRCDENSAMEVSALLADLRALQRRFQLAVLLVHHTRKANAEASGLALRGSSDLHAWGDSNIYLRRSNEQLLLAIEHRAARAPDPFALQLQGDHAPHLEVVTALPSPRREQDLQAEVLDLLRRHPTPMANDQIRKALRVRNQLLTTALQNLLAQNKISRVDRGWTSF